VLVERTHKAFPIVSDYVGLSVSTTFKEHIVVEIDNNEILGAYIR
jgi:pyrimidine operon attenuation protein/uracil phosphoribosyltransferase